MNLLSNDMQSIWIEGSSYGGDNTLIMFTQKILNKEGLKQ